MLSINIFLKKNIFFLPKLVIMLWAFYMFNFPMLFKYIYIFSAACWCIIHMLRLLTAHQNSFGTSVGENKKVFRMSLVWVKIIYKTLFFSSQTAVFLLEKTKQNKQKKPPPSYKPKPRTWYKHRTAHSIINSVKNIHSLQVERSVKNTEANGNEEYCIARLLMYL